MPAAYFRGDTHYQIAVKRSGKTDFYVIPSRDRNLTDERHVIGVYARILENFPANEGYVVLLDKFDGEPRKEKIDVSVFAGKTCSNQITKIQSLCEGAQATWSSLKIKVEKNKQSIQEAINIQKKISATFSNRDSNWQDEMKKRDLLNQELEKNADYREVVDLYEKYAELALNSLREIALLRFYDKTDSDKYLNVMTEFGSLKRLLELSGIDIRTENDPTGRLLWVSIQDKAESLMYLKSKISSR